MQYISTRGKAPKLSFEDAVITGLANDGGLYVPESYPTFSKEKIASLKDLSYQDLMFEVITPYVDGEIDDNTLKQLIDESYKNFRHEKIAPLKEISKNEYLLELFHGPTMAFKDFALQFLGNLFKYILNKRNQDVVIVGATSGDTGSAAIDGCKKSEHVKLFILHPHNRISDVQRKQMTSIIADNVFNIALEGNFDDCQHMVKELFNDQSFLDGKTQLVAVNSINWARILAQVVYYFYTALQLGAPDKQVSYSVPTGNFGDIFAGFIARKMGLPIKQLIVATNKNDILDRFIKTGNYERSELHKTLSPSMDIQVSSNLERLLFDLYNNDGNKIAELMNKFKTSSISIDKEQFDNTQNIFCSFSVDDEKTCHTIKQVFDECSEIIDPHTATGVLAARQCNKDSNVPMVILATAHPAKFPEATEKSGVGVAALPPHLSDLFDRKEKVNILPNDIEIVKEFIKKQNP